MILSESKIQQYWPLSNVRTGPVLQQSGERTTVEVTADEGKFVYKVADPIKTASALQKDTAVFDILRNKGFTHIPALLRTKNGDNFQPLGDKFVYVLEYIKGHRPERSPQTYRQLGEITAALHGISGYPYHTDFKASIVIRDLITNAARYPFGDQYKVLLERLPNFDVLPQTLIHTDIHPGNAIETADGTIVLVDWDDVGIGTRVLDIGYVITQCVSEENEFDERNARAFYDAYTTRHTLTQTELGYLFDAGLFFSLLYMQFGDIPKRWNRIQWLLANRSLMESIYAGR
jgi:Ser/Thr protein kinase RdoA (MazF antagonist)